MTKIAMRFVTTTDIPIGNALVAIRLTRSDYEEKTSGVLMPRLEEFHTDANGLLQVDLMPATALYHVTVYDTVQDIAIHHDFIVPVVEDPNTVLLLPDLIVPPDTVLSSFPFDEEALAKIIQAKVEAVAAALQSQASASNSAASAQSASVNAAQTTVDRIAVAADRIYVNADAYQVATDKQTVITNAAAALASKNAAATSAAEALASKNAAATSAAGASGSATAAATSATSASGSAATAVAAKDNAVTAKDQAAASQTAAANSAAAALASQASATQSASTATTAKNETLAYRDQANQSAQDALASKNSATASATSATASKDSAAASASASQTNATNAANSATAASTSAAQALASNNAASTSAANAFESARVAGVAATASQNSAAASAQSAADAAAALGNKLDKIDVSVAPAANKVPRAGANGAIDPAWIDTTKTSVLGKVQTNVNITVNSVGVPGIIEQLLLATNAGGSGVAGTAIHFGYPGGATYGSRIVGAGDPTLSLSGYTSFETGVNGGFAEKMRITGRGSLLIGATTDNNSNLLQVVGSGSFTPTGSEGTLLLKAGLTGSQSSMVLYAGNGNAFTQPSSVMYIGKYSATDRGITTLGTVNTMGNDYAEYVHKCLGCMPVTKGQIVGITAENTVTDKWASAVMFAIKSTEPSFVGGDSWSSHLGSRPPSLAGLEPSVPVRMYDVFDPNPLTPEDALIVVTPGDSDAEWEVKLANYTYALAKWGRDVEVDRVAMADFDTNLEVARASVDRIAIAGRVPVNVFGAQPGDYIVPVQNGEGINGIAVKEDDMTLRQYLRAVGQVITIEEDGRAYVMVKSV